MPVEWQTEKDKGTQNWHPQSSSKLLATIAICLLMPLLELIQSAITLATVTLLFRWSKPY